VKVKLSKLIIDPIIQIRSQNHESTIQRYMEAFEKLPAVDIVDCPEGLLLADGFHRVAAAERLGQDEIEAKITKGTRENALEIAVINNTKNADPLSPEERDNGIRRLRQIHPDWTLRQIGEAMSICQMTVKRVFDIDEVKRETITSPVTRVTNSHYIEIAKAPKKQWDPLVKAADERGWTRDVTALAVRNLKDDRLPEEHKKEILAGKADPLVITPKGEIAVPADIIGKKIQEMAKNDAVLQLEATLAALDKLALFDVDAIIETAGAERLNRIINEMGRYIEFMQRLSDSARASKELRRVK